MFINEIKQHFDKATRNTVVEALALSQINYCSILQGSANKNQSQRVQKLQNFSTKIVDEKAKKSDYVTHILKKLKWIKVEERYKLEIFFFVYEILNGEFYKSFMPLLTVGHVKQTSSRQANDLFIPRVNTDMG